MRKRGQELRMESKKRRIDRISVNEKALETEKKFETEEHIMKQNVRHRVSLKTSQNDRKL